MYNDISRMLDATVDARTITRADLDTYRVGSYRPDQPLGCRHALNGGGGGGGPRAPLAGSTPAEQFCRAIKKDKDHYPEFNDEKQFDNFRRAMESVARTHGTMNVLSPNFQVDLANQAQVDLFRVNKISCTLSLLTSSRPTSPSLSFVLMRRLKTLIKFGDSLLDHQQNSTTGELAP